MVFVPNFKLIDQAEFSQDLNTTMLLIWAVSNLSGCLEDIMLPSHHPLFMLTFIKIYNIRAADFEQLISIFTQQFAFQRSNSIV